MDGSTPKKTLAAEDEDDIVEEDVYDEVKPRNVLKGQILSAMPCLTSNLSTVRLIYLLKLITDLAFLN